MCSNIFGKTPDPVAYQGSDTPVERDGGTRRRGRRSTILASGAGGMSGERSRGAYGDGMMTDAVVAPKRTVLGA